VSHKAFHRSAAQAQLHCVPAVGAGRAWGRGRQPEQFL